MGEGTTESNVLAARLSDDDLGPTQIADSRPRKSEAPPTERMRYSKMPLLQILMVLIVVGILMWLVNNFIPMAGSIKSILNAVVVIGVVVWLLNVLGLLHSLSRIHVGA
jgi:hypothetical protein